MEMAAQEFPRKLQEQDLHMRNRTYIWVRALIEIKEVSPYCNVTYCSECLLDQDLRLQCDNLNLPCQSPFQNTWHSVNSIYCQSLSRAVKTGGKDKKNKSILHQSLDSNNNLLYVTDYFLRDARDYWLLLNY